MSNTTMEDTSMDDGTEIRKRAFERKARQATHQILFYLGLFYRPITFWTRSTHGKTEEVLKHDSDPVLARLQALVDGVGYRDDPAETDSWKLLRQKIEDCEHLWPYRVKDGVLLGEAETDSKLQELRDDCSKFLRDSRPRDFVTYITHLLNMGKLQIFRWLAKILISIVAIYLLFWFQQVAGLVRQTGWSTLLPFLLFLTAAMGPYWLGRYANLDNKQYWWDFGGEPFRNKDAQAPERGLCRFIKDSRVPLALLVRARMTIATSLVALAVALPATFLIASWQDMILFTVALILALLFVLYQAAQLLDFWDYYDPGPVRMFFLLILLFALWGINVYMLWLAPLLLWILFLGGLLWYMRGVYNDWKSKQKMELKDALWTNGQSAAVTAGLFSIAWLVTGIALTQFGEPWQDDGSGFKHLEEGDWPKPVKEWAMKPEEQASKKTINAPVVVLAASGGGSRAAIYVAQTLLMLHEKEFSHIGCNLQAISSVSGGSLANAVYITQRLGKPCNNALFEQLQGENGLMEAVAGDFLQPTIIGVLRGSFFWKLFGGGRSESIEKAWRDIGLDVKLDKLAEEWQKPSPGLSYPPFPIPLFNSTSLEAHRVVISPLQREYYVEPLASKRARERKTNLYDLLPTRYSGCFSEESKNPTWVYYRDSIYGLDDLLPDFTPDLAQCVRASANFPVGFPLVKIETTQPLVYSASKDRRSDEKEATDSVYLSDGGVLSNSGVWSLYHLLRNQHPKLKKRGVLVIIVDASAMQEYELPYRIEGLFGAIRDAHPIAQSLHRRAFESLKNLYGQRIQIVQIDLIPTQMTNIETTWTLSKQSRESLEKQFKARRDEFKEDLISAWNALVSDESDEGPTRYLERPPVD